MKCGLRSRQGGISFIGLVFVVGVLVGPINPLMVTLRHERAPTAIRGRVFSTYSAIAFAMAPLGILVTGNLVEGIGFNPTVIILAVVAQVLGVISMLLPGLREMNQPQVENVTMRQSAVADAAD